LIKTELFSENLLTNLEKSGFTKYEAKTYLGLLKHNPATGYEISQEAHIPRSVIYTILRRLEARGLVISIHDKPRRYLPLAPKQLLSRLEQDSSSRLTRLKDDLEHFNHQTESEGFWNLRGYELLLSTCKTLISEAHHSIYISGWKREIEALRQVLENAHKRKVTTVIFSFNDVESDLGSVFAYGIPEAKLEKVWDHKLIVVTDNQNLVMGPANQKETEQAIWTQNRAALTIATNYIILDITLYAQRCGLNLDATISQMMVEEKEVIDQLIAEAVQARGKSERRNP